MLENKDMASVASLVNDTSIGGPNKEMLDGIPNQKGKKPKGLVEKKPVKEPVQEDGDEKTQAEMDQAASLGIIDQKYAQEGEEDQETEDDSEETDDSETKEEKIKPAAVKKPQSANKTTSD